MKEIVPARADIPRNVRLDPRKIDPPISNATRSLGCSNLVDPVAISIPVICPSERNDLQFPAAICCNAALTNECLR